MDQQHPESGISQAKSDLAKIAPVTSVAGAAPQRPRALRKWIRRAFLAWATFSTLWLANSYRTQGVPRESLVSSETVTVASDRHSLQFLTNLPHQAGLILICGSGVAAEAYAPLLRPIAEAGFATFIVRLPHRFAPFDADRSAAVDEVQKIAASHRGISRWILAGHSLGAALACRAMSRDSAMFAGLVLIGSTHPVRIDLSSLTAPVTKVYGSEDGVAPKAGVDANRRLLPPQTRWLLIPGGNHSQFAHYGHQLMDGTPTISRTAQQQQTRDAIPNCSARGHSMRRQTDRALPALGGEFPDAQPCPLIRATPAPAPVLTLRHVFDHELGESTEDHNQAEAAVPHPRAHNTLISHNRGAPPRHTQKP